MKIFFSVGEPSGDLHGANLIRKLRALNGDVKAVGYGGPKMAAAGCEIQEDMTHCAVMWFARVLLKLPTFYSLYLKAGRYFRNERPDAVVLIDFPGFNWWIARKAKRYGIPVFYYGPPQIWAWARWRIGKMRRRVDHILCKLAFEEEWYRERDCQAVYVGHPYFDELNEKQLDKEFLAQLDGPGPLVTILPGSRTQEVTQNLKWLLKAATRIKRQVPNVRFAIAAYQSQHASIAHKWVATTGLPVDIFVNRTAELIHRADCCMAVSGSVSLELLHYTKPTVILYSISRFAYFVQRFFRKVKYITLVNLLNTNDRFSDDVTPYDPNSADADGVLMPEYVTYQDKSEEIAGHIVEWLTDGDKREQCVSGLRDLKAEVSHPGASRRAAEYILRNLRLAKAAAPLPRPHFPTSRSDSRRPKTEDLRLKIEE